MYGDNERWVGDVAVSQTIVKKLLLIVVIIVGLFEIKKKRSKTL